MGNALGKALSEAFIAMVLLLQIALVSPSPVFKSEGMKYSDTCISNMNASVECLDEDY